METAAELLNRDTEPEDGYQRGYLDGRDELLNELLDRTPGVSLETALRAAFDRQRDGTPPPTSRIGVRRGEA